MSKNKKNIIEKGLFLQSLENVPIHSNDGADTSSLRTILYLQKNAQPIDGRPVISFDAEQLVADANAYISRAGGLAFDYEHQIDMPVSNGGVPAAAWAKNFFTQDGNIYVTFEPTPKLAEYIANGEYKAFSPTLGIDTVKKVFSRIVGGGFTNRPAFLQNFFASEQEQDETQNESDKMLFSKIKETLKATYKQEVAEDATDEQVLAQYEAVLAGETQKVEAYAVQVATLNTQIETLTGEVSTYKAEVESYKTKAFDAEFNSIYTEALTAGKVSPAQRDSLYTFAKTDLATFKTFLENAPAKTLSQTVVAPGAAVEKKQIDAVEAELYAEAEKMAKSIQLNWADEKIREAFVAQFKKSKSQKDEQ